MPRILITYQKPDTSIAGQLAKELERRANEVRLNLVGVAGPDQSEEIARLIHDSDVWIFMLGRDRRLSTDMVKLFSVTEKVLSIRSDLIVLPVVQSGVPLPVLLSRFQAYFFESEKEFNYVELVNYIDRSLKGVKASKSANIDTGYKAPPPAYRLSKVLRELNVSMDTILKFLEERGVSVERNPNAKISQDTYQKLLAGLADGQLKNEERVPVTRIAMNIGSKGETVREAQIALRDLGYKIVVDGIYGEQTSAVVRSFQAQHELKETGDIDETTLNQLKSMAEEMKAKLSRERRYWLLAFNLDNWGIENIRPGEIAHFNSYISNGEKRTEYVLYGEVMPGDKILGYDFFRNKAVICLFRVINGLYNEPRHGEIIELEVEQVYAQPFSLAPFSELRSFLDDLSDRTAARLTSLSENLFERIISNGSEGQISRPQLHSAAARLHSDDADPIDQLQYELYAEAIASIIRDSKASPPPLNIAIIAPWGQGKTTLMRYIRKRFEPNPPSDETPAAIAFSFGMLWQRFGTSWKWLQKIKGWFVEKKKQQLVDALRDARWKPQSLKHPTVWFNPWRYHSSDQIWAGLGHAMITQLVAKLEPIHREQFWLHLSMKRIDGNAIRRDIRKRIIETLLPATIVALMVAGLLVVGAVTYTNQVELFKWLGGLSGVGFVAACWTNLRNFFSKNLEGKLASYVREPDYAGKLGLFHEINDDLTKVCNLLIDESKPAIVFIDDLDRCSPKIVTEVIEAINLMMTSEFRNRCYFVFGMDAQMVSAALDAQYSSMAGKFADKEKIHGSVGWYFLDKFIQLPFFIPVLNPQDKEAFLRRFFFDETVKAKSEETVVFEPAEVAADVQEALKGHENFEVVLEKYKSQPTVLQNGMTQEVMKQSKDSADIVQEVIKYATYLDGSPRGLKRFANLLRFYHTQQKMRVYFPTSSASGSTATTKSLAKWLVINLRWPQMVRWVQWEYEELLLHSAEPEVKAKHIDGMIAQLASKLSKDADPYAAWLELLGENKEEIKKKSLHLKWLRDRDLFFLLYNNNHEDATLEKALQFDVW